MRSLAIAAASLLVICGTAAAADLSQRPIRKALDAPPLMGWNGFYLGLNAGGSLGNGRSDFSIAGSPAFASVNNSLAGAIAGAQVGFNWQTDWSVFGFETDFQAANVKGGLSAPCAAGLCGLALTATYNQEVTWFGTVRGRLGVANAGWLIYATGGYAYARLETSAFAAAGAVSASFSQNETRNGWTAGGGIEVALAPQWSAKLEYLYLDFGRTTTSWTLTGLPAIVDDARLTMNVVRAGVNFRF